RARAILMKAVSDGGWGPAVPGKRYELGDQGEGVAALRHRLGKLGYTAASETEATSFDVALDQAVRDFQTANGLTVDGIAGPVTLGEVNRTPAERLGSVLVALERERWLPRDLGERYVEVNIPAFTARLKEHEETIFETRAVTGKNRSTHRTPEFSDEMEYMVVNPTWNVPRSITTREYLPKLQQNPAAVGHLTLINRQGQTIDRATVDFASFTASNFPYRLKQQPGTRNALGRVKFMFPNRYNIYLHDTPQKALFARESRAFSHGCIRLADPQDFAVALLTPQSDTPASLFQRKLDAGRESRITLESKLPVHLIYRTARVTPDGRIVFRRDVYGRDAKILAALIDAGVPAGSGES
ncbi:MAG: L,D-transpeptidase family protein, partial [Pseudomonadota bacterium]